MPDDNLQEFKTAEEMAADETLLVSGMLRGVTEIAGIIQPGMLHDVFCRAFFAAYAKSHKRGEPVDLGRMAQALGGDGQGRKLVNIRCDTPVRPDEAISLAKQLRQRHAGAVAAEAMENELTYIRFGFGGPEAMARVAKVAEEYQRTVSGDMDDSSIAGILDKHGDRIFEGRSGVPIGIPSLDRFLDGLVGGDLIIFGGRPKRGKSSAMATIAALVDVPCAIFSLEMTRLEYLRKMICIIGKIRASDLVRRMNEVDAIKAALRQRSLHIFDVPALNIPEISSHCYGIPGLRLAVIDYAQLLGRLPGTKDSRESLAESVKALKTLAKKLGITIVLGSQVNREGDAKASSRTLAESDELLRSADSVLLLDWKNEDAPAETEWMQTPVEVTVNATCRHGSGGTFPMWFYRGQGRFAECGAEGF